MRTTKSPKRLLLAAHELGRRVLRKHWHHRAPKKFTLPQLFACLTLKEFYRLDYRKLATLLSECPALPASIGMKSVPHFTTFQKAAQRLLDNRRVHRMLDTSVAMGQELGLLGKRVSLAAIDATGLESSTASRYYSHRRKGALLKGKQAKYVVYHEFPKLAVVSDCSSHLIFAIVHDRGPSNDRSHFRAAVDQGHKRVPIDTLLADAGYDSEAAHTYSRETHGIRTLIPAANRSKKGNPPRGRWRCVMAQRLHNTRYSQRAQVETTISLIKRLLGSQLRARTKTNQRRETNLRVLTLNLLIL